MKILHNPRCRKSREGLGILEESGVDFEIVDYLKNPLSKEEIEDLLSKLDLEAIDLVRKNEPIWKQEYRGRDLTHAEIVAAMQKNPKLIERPVVISGERAVVGRPPEKIRELLS